MVAIAERREIFWQLLRYGVNGSIVTGLYSLVFAGLDSWSRLPTQLCNLAGYLSAVTLGYVLHSRVTFRDHGSRGRHSQLRFLLASVPSLALNSFWVWLFDKMLHWPHWTIYVPIWLVTPAMIFVVNRWWVFR
ncbi:MAG TPA: GtrA family protein [Sphingomonas sp.]|nr:GtrA family protein [Sphingomonas sp.]